MTPLLSRKSLATALLAAGLASSDAGAVYLNPDGYGQALIFPYYTVQSTGADSWNTYLSVVNHEPVAKVARVSVREGRNGRAVATFNVYLAPHDVWTSAIVPASASPSSGAVLVTWDRSCTNPDLPSSGLHFVNTWYAGSQSDGLGDGLDRTREGYVEIIEMATLGGAAASAVNLSNGQPDDCSAVQGSAVALTGMTFPPSGGLSGTLTLINVNTGMDAAVNATALADLTTAPFYRNYSDGYPDFSAAEVRPVSHVITDGKAYRLDWTNGVDAVSSVLMSARIANEFVLDQVTNSQSDWILAFPTRRLYSVGTKPFGTIAIGDFSNWFSDRASRTAATEGGEGACGFYDNVCGPVTLKAALVMPIKNARTTSGLLASKNTTDREGDTTDTFQSGWRYVRIRPGSSGFGQMESLATSTSTDHVTGQTATGRFSVQGLPVLGFAVRTFQNGLLSCATGACQGNYGGAFPHRYQRAIVPLAP